MLKQFTPKEDWMVCEQCPEGAPRDSPGSRSAPWGWSFHNDQTPQGFYMQRVELLRSSNGRSLSTQGGAALPLTLGCFVQLLRSWTLIPPSKQFAQEDLQR